MELDDIRNKIDLVDDKIAALFKQRMALLNDVASLKRASNLTVFCAEREKQVMRRTQAELPDDIKIFGERLFETLMQCGKAYQYLSEDAPAKGTEFVRAIASARPFPKEAKIACASSDEQGVLAAGSAFENSKTVLFENSDDVFFAVAKGICDFGLIEVCGGGADIALENIKNGEFFIARVITLGKDAFSISDDARTLSGGHCKKERARYALICREQKIFEGADKISFYFSVKNEAESLSAAFGKFALFGFAATPLAAIIGGETAGFYVEFAGNIATKEAQALISALAAECEEFALLGAYEEI